MARVQAERHDVGIKVEGRSMQLDDTVRDRNVDCSELEKRRRWHSKLITCKIMFQQLYLIQLRKEQGAFKELAEYSKFDKGCHSKLKNFAMTLHKLGNLKCKMALNKWYDNSLKPLYTIRHNNDLAMILDCN